MLGMMTFADAKKLLPKFAKNIAKSEYISSFAIDAVRVAQLRNCVEREITAWRSGDNPLSVNQVEALETWLRNTATGR